MKLHRYFPTTIGYYSDPQFINQVLPIAREFLTTATKENNNWHYKNTYFDSDKTQELSNIPFIKEYIFNLASTYIQEIGMNLIRDINLSCFVSNMEKGDYHPSHDHPKSILSGVCYLNTSEQCGGITFYDPRKIKLFTALEKNETNTIDNSSSINYYPKTGDILIWESWLEHSVEINNCNKRETLVFNLG